MKAKLIMSPQKVLMARTYLTMIRDNRIDEYIEYLYRHIHNTAILSADNHTMTCQMIVDKLVERMALKQIIINTKNKIESLIKSLDPSTEKVIRFYFFDKMVGKALTEAIGANNERAAYRKVEESLHIFAGAMERHGLNTYSFNYLMEESKWARGIMAESTSPYRQS